MLYCAEHGPHEQALIKICIKEKRPFPEFIQNAPELMPGLELYLEAFWELSTCRQIGWGTGPIPWQCISEWCRMQECSPEETEEFTYLIRSMDNTYLEWRNKQDKAS